jgi:hypothetical protein
MRQCEDCLIGGVMVHQCPVCGSVICGMCVGHHESADHGRASFKSPAAARPASPSHSFPYQKQDTQPAGAVTWGDERPRGLGGASAESGK